MPYADLPTVYQLLDLDAVDPDDQAARDRVDQLNDEMSRLFELKTGRAWGDAAPAQARTVAPPHGAMTYEFFWNWQPMILPLPAPVRSVTAVAITGDAAETLDAGDWVLWQQTRRGDAHAIRRIDGGIWPSRDGRNAVTVTAVWSDLADGTPAPVEVVETVNFLVVETFRLEQTSPTGEIGAEGQVFRARNPWRFEQVTTAIARYRAALPVPGF